MPITPYHAIKAILTKSPRQGNDETFSNQRNSVVIDAWEVWNSRTRRRNSYISKIYGDDVSAVIRTHNAFASELECDDSITHNGFTYSVQGVRPVKTALSLSSTDYEILV